MTTATAGDPAPRRGAAGWHPASVVSLAIGLVAVAFTPPAPSPAAAVAAGAVVAVALATAVQAGPAARRRWWRWSAAAWLPLALSLVAVHGLVFPEGEVVLAAFGPLAVTAEGLTFAAAVAARWLAVAAAMALVAALTTPADLAQAVEDAPWPPLLGHAVAGALLLVPAARRAAIAIAEAQRARGLRTDGSIGHRVRAVAPRVVPLAVAVVLEGQARAQALAVRGCRPGAPRTALAPLPDSVRQRWSRRLGLAVAVAGWLAVRGVGLGAGPR